jgi:tape measure domain-containing protein
MAGQNADMTLKVGLDLNFFRQELQKASSALAGQPIDINIRFKRDKISNELRLLSNSLSRKKYDVEVKSTSLEALLKQVNAFKQTLAALKKEDISLDVKVESSISGAKAAEARRDIISKITGPKGAIFVPIEVKPPLVKNINAIRKGIKDSLSGIVIEVEAKLKGGIAPAGAAGVSGGEAGRAKRPSFLDSPAYQAELTKIAKANAQALAKAAASLPSGRNRQEVERLLQAFQSQNPQGANRSAALGAIRELIARGRYQQGLGFEASLQPLRGQRQTSAERSMPNLNEMLDRIANLTENPRAAQRMLRMMPERRITTDLIGAANKQAEFKQEGLKFLDLKGKAFDPLLKAIAKDFTEYTKSVGTTNPWIGKTGTVLADFLSKGIMSASARELYERVRDPQQAGQLLLPAAGQTSASRMTRQMFEGLPAIQSPQIGMEQAPLSRAASYMVNKARRALGMSIGPASPYSQNPFAGAATVPPRSFFRFGQGPQLPGAPIQAALPPAGTTTNYGGGGFFGYGGVTGSGGDGGRGGAIVPFAGGATPPGGGGGFGGAGGFGGFGRALGGINLPGAGTIRELGDEFGFATKQVLLFGQAYKLLGVIQAFPAQVGAAVGQLQSFRNTLNAVTPSAEEARASNELLLGLMEKYNVPLQSARDGFTKLYASMAPAGFSGDEIRDLFTGITKAAATFGMSADKVDRVNYAFAQMASKGQVMSEELKGQLGDVLPGAMALFAEAAGFKGPKAIQDFSAALEDGAYKGEAMVALLKNVTVVMNKEFGPGAEGAALTFQGVMNRMQNSMTLLYESFEPVAVGFLNTVVVPMTNGIKQLTDGLNAFFTGTAAKTAGGFAIAQELERLRPSFDGIGQNVQKLVPVFQQFANVALNVAKVFLEIAGNPFVGYLLRVYAAVLPLTLALQVLNLQALIPMIASFVRSAYALTVFTVQCAKAGQAAAIAKLSFQTAGITLRTFFASTGVGLVLVGIGLLIERFTSMNQALEDTRNKALGAAQAIRSMSQTEARAAEQQAQTAYKTIGSVAGRQGPQQQGGDRLVPVSERELKQLQSLGAIREQRDPSGQIYVKRSQALSLAQQAQRIKSEAAFRQEQIKFEEKQAAMPVTIAPISGAASDGKGTKAAKEKKERESQVPLLQLQLATTKQLFDLERDILAARLGGNDLEVIRLEGLRQQLQINEEIAKINLEKDIPGQEKALQIERLRKQSEGERLRTAFEIEQKIQEVYSGISDAVTKIAQDSANELADKQSYEKLVSEGVLPSIAKITVETNRQFAVEAQKLSVLETQIKDQIALLSAKEKISDEDQKQLNILKERLGIIQGGQADLPGLAQEAMQARISGEQPLSGRVVALEEIESMRRELEKLTSWEYQAVQGAQAVGSALAEAMTTGVAGMISGTATAKEVFASFLQSVGQALSQAASQMIATYIAIGIAKMFAGFGGGGQSSVVQGVDVPVAQMPAGMAFADGGIAPGGFQAFANGGVVSGPTLGLVGEGRYNEAVVPLPNGRAIPVQINGERSARDLMGRNAPGMANAAPLTLKFESTKINGVEYVSREQLELAMAETRRASIAGGATRGMNMALDKIQQSPSTRSRIGIR